MLLDDYLPVYDVRERHATLVRASAERVYEAIWSANLASPLVRTLMGLRAAPGALAAAAGRPHEALRRLRERTGSPARIRDLLGEGFALIAEDPPREVLLGLVGAFWRLGGDLRSVDATSFREPAPAGTARAAWNFRVEPHGDAACVLSTETRVQCADAAARRRFRVYWLLIQPGSGLIRRSMLGSIRRAAEG